MIKARVIVTLKSGVLDPQGKAIEGALNGLGYSGVGSVRQARCSTSSSTRPTGRKLRPI